MVELSFKPLSAEDLPLLHGWLNRPHMRPFYQKTPISFEQVVEKYTPRIENKVPTSSHVVFVGERPIGKIQCYKTADYPEYAHEIGVFDGISVDLFIGDPDFLGKGIGKTLLHSYLAQIAFPKFPKEKKCYICHEKNNLAALTCSKSVGFTFLRDVIEGGTECELLVYEKPLPLIPTDLHKRLVEELSGSELQSLLMHVFSDRAKATSAPEVLNSWLKDRFVKPCPISPREFAALDLKAFEAASNFEPIELSPVCPLGTNVSVAPMSQNKVVGTIRNTEVVADSTNVMALECAVRRKQLLKEDPKSTAQVKLCSSHRLVRAQKFSSPLATAHFRVFALCTAGRDTGSFEFEANAFSDHILTYDRLLRTLSEKGYKIGRVSVGLYGKNKIAVEKIAQVIESQSPGVSLGFLGERESSYYPEVSFKLKIQDEKGSDIEIGDGGTTVWTQKLISNSKERLMISGIGCDRLISAFKLAGENQ